MEWCMSIVPGTILGMKYGPIFVSPLKSGTCIPEIFPENVLNHGQKRSFEAIENDFRRTR